MCCSKRNRADLVWPGFALRWSSTPPMPLHPEGTSAFLKQWSYPSASDLGLSSYSSALPQGLFHSWTTCAGTVFYWSAAQAELLKLQFTSQVQNIASAVTAIHACRERRSCSWRWVTMQKQQKRRKANTDYCISGFATQNFITFWKHDTSN